MTATQHQLGRTRTRWAAIGAAVAVTLGAGGLGLVQAADDDSSELVYKTSDVCRLLDTRDEPHLNVGARNTPIGEGESYLVDANNDDGDCAIPTTAKVLVANVTVTETEAPTFVTFYSGDLDAPPLASHNNLRPDMLERPNQVMIDLNAAGEFYIYNAFKNINVIVDVMGWFEEAHPDGYDDSALWAAIEELDQSKLDTSVFNDFYDNEYSPFYDKTKTEITEIWEYLNNLEFGSEIVANYYQNGEWDNPQDEIILDWDLNVATSQWEAVAQISFDPPEDGLLSVHAQAQVYDITPENEMVCQLASSTVMENDYPQAWLDLDPVDGAIAPITHQRVFEATEGETLDVFFVCGEMDQAPGTPVEVHDPTMIGLFVPTD